MSEKNWEKGKKNLPEIQKSKKYKKIKKKIKQKQTRSMDTVRFDYSRITRVNPHLMCVCVSVCLCSVSSNRSRIQPQGETEKKTIQKKGKTSGRAANAAISLGTISSQNHYFHLSCSLFFLKIFSLSTKLEKKFFFFGFFNSSIMANKGQFTIVLVRQ